MSETELKVGDTVKIKHHTQCEKEQYPFRWAMLMNQHEGETFVVKKILHELKSPYSGKIETGYKLENPRSDKTRANSELGTRKNIFTWHESSLIKIGNTCYQTF